MNGARSYARACGMAATLLALACCFPTEARGGDWLADFKVKTAAIAQVRSHFVQETAIPMFAQPMRSSGRFVFKRPDALRWEYTEPMQEGFVLKGGAGFRWEESPAKRTPFTAASDPAASVVARQLVAWITFDEAAIRREYRIEPLETETLRLRMLPLRDDVRSVIASITIRFTAEGTASQVDIQEQRGGKTTIVFTRTVINGAMDDGEFD